MDKLNFLVLGFVLLLCVCCTTEKPAGLDGAPDLSADKNISVDQTTLPGIVTISTDKTEYSKGEVIKIVVENQMDKPIFYGEMGNLFWDLEYLKNGNWTNPVYNGSPGFQLTQESVGDQCFISLFERTPPSELKPQTNFSSEWNQRICPIGEGGMGEARLVRYVENGEYRLVFHYGFEVSKEDPYAINGTKTVYSNAFTVFNPGEGPSKPETILSNECLAGGGEITNYQLPEGHDPYEQFIPSCSDDRKNLGFVTDVNCLCICCK